jgi:putative endopeptidase
MILTSLPLINLAKAIKIAFLLYGITFCLSAIATMTGQPGFQLENIDQSIAPGNDFFSHANGNWLNANPIPDSESRWGTFNILRKKNTRQIRYILEAAAENTSASGSSDIRKIGDFYATGMDREKADRLGLAALRPELEMIDAIKNLYDLQNTLQHLQLRGINAMFNLGQMQDYQNSKLIIAVLDQAGLGLPDRDYYFRQDKKSLAIRSAYLGYLATLFRMLGENQNTSRTIAKSILELETALAKESMSRPERRDPKAIYHPVTRKQLNKIMPSFSWKNYFEPLALKDTEIINVTNPSFFRALNKLLNQRPLTDWKNYLRWRLLDATSHALSTPFVDQAFAFNSKLSGSKEIKQRWQRVTDESNRILGFAIGRIYVNLYFPETSKKRVLDILNNVRSALRTRLETQVSLTPATRLAAINKLDSMRQKIAYPGHWRDYSRLNVTRTSYVRNVLEGNTFLIRRELDKIGNPSNRNEWLLTPQSVNAYYNPSMNEIVFPAGILQPPFFDSSAPESLNYGAIGAVIGHEISHGFDDQGRLFDANGNVTDWWTKQDKRGFKDAAACITRQYDRYTVDGDAQLNGKLVTGEAIADLVGLSIAWQAFSESTDVDMINPAFKLPEARLFFYGFAHLWAGSARPAYLRKRVQTDPHPPAEFRVNGTLKNFPPFAKTFSLQPGDELRTNSPCTIW